MSPTQQNVTHAMWKESLGIHDPGGVCRQLLEDNNIPMSKQAFDQTYKAAAAVDRSSDQCTLATFLQQRQQS